MHRSFGVVNLLSAKASLILEKSICFRRKHRSFRRGQFAFGESVDHFGEVNLLSAKASILSAKSICFPRMHRSFRRSQFELGEFIDPFGEVNLPTPSAAKDNKLRILRSLAAFRLERPRTRPSG